MSSFPSMISNEPPPLEMTSDEEDSEEFQTPGLKLDVASAEPSPMSTPLKKSLQQRSSSPGKGESVILPDRPVDFGGTNGHLLEEESPSSFGKRPSLQGQSSEETGLKTPGSTSETGPHSTPSSPSDQDEFSDCQNQEFYDDIPPETEPQIGSLSSSPPKMQDLVVEIPSSELSVEEQVVRSNPIDPVISCDTSATVVDDEVSEFKETVEKLSEENANSDDLVEKDSLVNVNELTNSVEKVHIDSRNVSEDKLDFSMNSEQPALQAELCEPVSNSSNNEATTCSAEVEDSEDFGDFEAFPTTTLASSNHNTDSAFNNAPNNEMKTSYIGEVNDDDDDGFGDFASTPRLPAPEDSFQSSSNPVATNNNQLYAQPQSTTQLDDDDDFADFQDFQDATPSTSQAYSEPHPNPKISSRSTSFSQSFTSPRMSADFTAALESKFDLLIKNVIPKDSSQSSNPANSSIGGQTEDEGERQPVSEYSSIDKEIKGSSDTCWNHVQDFEESKGLLYKWLNSLSQQRMYKSLKIDSSNIVYTQKWGAIEVPKFAASMVETPILQPQVFSNSSPVNESVRKSSVPTPDDATNSTYKKTVSKEARQILQQIPDISFMTAKTIVFPQTNRTAANSLL